MVTFASAIQFSYISLSLQKLDHLTNIEKSDNIMSNAWVPANFARMADNISEKDVDNASLALLSSLQNSFAPLEDQSTMTVKKNTRAVENQSTCAGCFKVIDRYAVAAMDKLWHTDCFQCSQCAQLIENGSFVVRQNQPWCKKCVDWTQGKKIIDSIAGGTQQRQVTNQAPNCRNTRVNLGHEAPQKKVGHDIDTLRGFKPQICSKCKDTVRNGVEYAGESYCLECFKCSSCYSLIDPTEGFLPNNGAFICAPCSKKLSQSSKQTKSYQYVPSEVSSTSQQVVSSHNGIRVDPRSGKVTASRGFNPVKIGEFKFCPRCTTKTSGSHFCSKCGLDLQTANMNRRLNI